jgi:hypothetical protein
MHGGDGALQSSNGGSPVEQLGAACEDVQLRAREGAQMLLENLDGLRRIAEGGEFAAPGPSAVGRFVEAVLALSDDPAPRNVERYLVASRALDDSSSRKRPRTRRAA